MFQLAFAAFSLALATVAHGYRNVTVHDSNPDIIYSPPGEWMHWPPGGCLDNNGGQWTRNTGGASITYTFNGTAIYVYGLFDDEIHPIYTIDVDGDVTTLGSVAAPYEQRCDPLYSKTGLEFKEHTIVFTLTGDRPSDNKDLSFDGFIYTVPDPEDLPRSNSNSSKSSVNIPMIAGIAGGVVAVVALALVIFFVRRSRARRAAELRANRQSLIPSNEVYPHPRPSMGMVPNPQPPVWPQAQVPFNQPPQQRPPLQLQQQQQPHGYFQQQPAQHTQYGNVQAPYQPPPIPPVPPTPSSAYAPSIAAPSHSAYPLPQHQPTRPAYDQQPLSYATTSNASYAPPPSSSPGPGPSPSGPSPPPSTITSNSTKSSAPLIVHNPGASGLSALSEKQALAAHYNGQSSQPAASSSQYAQQPQAQASSSQYPGAGPQLSEADVDRIAKRVAAVTGQAPSSSAAPMQEPGPSSTRPMSPETYDMPPPSYDAKY